MFMLFVVYVVMLENMFVGFDVGVCGCVVYLGDVVFIDNIVIDLCW